MDSNLSIGYSFLRNLSFLLLAGILFTVIARLLVKDPAERKGITKGVCAMLILIGGIWFWSVADLRLPSFDQVVAGNNPSKVATVASVPTTSGGSTKATPKSAAPTPAATSTTGEKSFGDIFALGAGDGQFSDGISYQLYTIQPGDTIYSISKRFGVSQTELAQRNGVNPEKIVAGKTLKIPMN